MRVVSLLPSLTELVWALGQGIELVGVSHECDFPPEVTSLPRLTRDRLPPSASSEVIDNLVSSQGSVLYELDAELLASLEPDLILTQTQCDVCALNETTVRREAARLPGPPHVESVNPLNLSDIFNMFRRVGDLLDARDAAEQLVARFNRTAAEIVRRRDGQPELTVAHLEWLAPPFTSGHWNPELTAVAGGRDVLGRPGEASRRVTWEEVAEAAPEVVLLAPCGFTLERSGAELPKLLESPAWRSLPAVRSGRAALIDGSAYFSRPGPRLEESLRIAAAVIDPDRCADLAPESGWKWLANGGDGSPEPS